MKACLAYFYVFKHLTQQRYLLRELELSLISNFWLKFLIHLKTLKSKAGTIKSYMLELFTVDALHFLYFETIQLVIFIVVMAQPASIEFVTTRRLTPRGTKGA